MGDRKSRRKLEDCKFYSYLPLTSHYISNAEPGPDEISVNPQFVRPSIAEVEDAKERLAGLN